MPTSAPEWGVHDPVLYECGGVLRGIGLPYVYFRRPSLTLVQISPETANDAHFEPQGYQLLQCSKCREFEYGLYAPFTHRVIIGLRERNLPMAKEWDWAWETVPSEVKRRYRIARHLWGERPNGTFEESLREIRICLEEIVDSILTSKGFSFPEKTPLGKRIKELKNLGLSEPRLTTLADKIRVLSNPAHHGGKAELDKKPTRRGVFEFDADGTIAMFLLDALIAHVFLHPALRIRYDTQPEWTSFFNWLESVQVRLVLSPS